MMARGRRDVSQSPERDHGLRPDAGRGVGQRREERRGLDAVELRLAVGQRPQCELADGGVAGELPQDAVRPGAVELLEREEGRDAPVQGLGRVGRQVGEGPGRLRRSAAAQDLALAVEARGRIGAAQPVDQLGQREPPSDRTVEVGLQPGGATHARKPTCGPT